MRKKSLEKEIVNKLNTILVLAAVDYARLKSNAILGKYIDEILSLFSQLVKECVQNEKNKINSK